jgi:hypothetical protein
VLSIDTKKTAWRGHVHRAGTPCTAATVATFDHEFGAASEGTRMPHGVYDVVHQHAPIHRKARHDPSAWRCDRGALWWEHAGRAAPPPATRLWVRGDGGGSTSATPSLVQEDLPGLAHRLGLARRVAHAPPYCSQHHPREHRVFPPITRACQGVSGPTVDIARPCSARAQTPTGLRVTVRMRDQGDQTGRTDAAAFTQNMTILFDDHLSKWNYRAVPACT